MAGPESSTANAAGAAPPADWPETPAAELVGVGEAEIDEVDRFARLERLVRTLVARFESERLEGAALREERDALRQELEGRERRMRELEEELRESNQTRQDVGKRIDDLLTQLDGIVGDEASG